MRAAVHDDRRRQNRVATRDAPVERQALSEPAPQPQARPACERAGQRGEGETGQQAGDAPLHAAEGEHPDQPQHAPPKLGIWFAAAAMNADTLRVHRLQFGFGGVDEHLDVGERVPRVALMRTRDAVSREGNHISWTGRVGNRQTW